MDQLSEEISELKEMVNEMHIALMGSKITKDGGLVGRIDLLEETVEQLETKIDELSNKDVKFEIYQKLLWSAAGFIVCSIIALFLQNIFKR